MLVYVGMTLAWAHFMRGSLTTSFPHDSGDPLLNSWILWWNAARVPFSAAWWNAPAFYPATGVAAFTESLVGFAPLTNPVIWISGNSVLAHNLALLASFPLAGFCAYLLCYEITRDRAAAFVGGIAFAFAPYRVAQIPHLQVLQSCWLPLVLFALHRYLATAQTRWLALFGAAWILNAWTNGYYLLFLAVLLAGWLTWFVIAPGRWRDLVRIVSAAGIASVPLAVVLWKYQSIHARYGFARDFEEIRGFSADIAALVNGSSQLTLWGWVRRFPHPEGELFPGVALVVLIIVGLFVVLASVPSAPSAEHRWRRVLRAGAVVAGLVSIGVLIVMAIVGPGRWEVAGLQVSIRSAMRPAIGATLAIAVLVILRFGTVRRDRVSAAVFYIAAAPVVWLFTLGPDPTLFGERVLPAGWSWAAPYSWLLGLPGFDSLRVPARFWMLVVLCLSVVASFAFSRLASRASRWRPALLVLVAAALVADGWASGMPVVPARRVWNCAPPALQGEALALLPVGEEGVDLTAMDLAMQWGLPSVNGYSGYFAPHYETVVYGLALHDPGTLDDLAGERGVFVAVPTAEVFRRDFVAAHPRAVRVTTCGGLEVFRVAGQSARSNVAEPLVGRPAPIAAITAQVGEGMLANALDGDRTTRWHSGPQDEPRWLQADLGEPREIAGVVLEGGRFSLDFPRHLTVSVSTDGASWDVVWSGPTHRRVFGATLADPRRAPLYVAFPARRARYVKLQQSGRDREYWSVAELVILER